MEMQLINYKIIGAGKAQRIRWLGHVEQMTQDRMSIRILKGSMTGRRRQGRPRNCWKDEVESDLKKMNVRRWPTTAQSRSEWKEVVRQAKAHPEL